MALKKAYRLKKKKEFEEVREKGRVWHGAKISLAMLEKNDGGTRVGVVVSKKVDKRAVGRNRLRRLVAEVFRKNWEVWGKQNRWLVVIVRRNQLSLGEVENELAGLIQKLGTRQETGGARYEVQGTRKNKKDNIGNIGSSKISA